ncbi:MAG: sigma-54-dependent Fis family transcriptional regulator [Spirochaetales bacterium]|nr:sigma-54-dependent Fis family transcriptional regulator [Spirochaetales bacterium]
MNRKKFNLLIADDEPDMISRLRRVFRKKDYELHSALGGTEALKIIDRENINAALIDMRMPGMDGLELLKAIKKIDSKIQVVIMTGFGEIEHAVEAMRLGAVDYIEKPVRNEKLLALIEQIEIIFKLESENASLKEQMDFTFGFDHLIGNSEAMLKLKKTIKQIGPADTSVLIQGETGTGKELIARALHTNSLRKDQAFVAVDCAAISETMMESELFGHTKGSFTGALNSSPGLMRAADRGSLFFDEIGELPLNVQSKLLRSIQQREVRPVGSTLPVSIDVRIIAATNRDLLEETRAGRFREDLYYRLNVITLKSPPLRERRDDIPNLAKYFLKKFSIGKTQNRVEKQGLDYLSEQNWPGNVRELENCIRRLIAFAGNKIISLEEIIEQLDQTETEVKKPDNIAGASADMPDGESLEDYEKIAIMNALEKCHGNRKAAAELLDIGEATLYRKIKKYSF